MHESGPIYVGIDLGTTNSSAAVFDGEQVTPVRNATGTALTPSLVRIDGSGRISVGHRARKFLAHDPDSVRGEFKRLMGTRKGLTVASNTRRPEELAAELLRALRRDIETQVGVAPDRAVITVPALFELPQIAATREAARLAGFTEVEMLQEPVASALAAGFRADHSHGHWLVYDLGGGTFDVSLLAARDGFVDVVGHDGDNFLGGRDLDWALVQWACEQIEREHGVVLSRANSAHTPILGKLKRALEDAKIELSQVSEASVVCPDLIPHPDGARHLELQITQADLEAICEPVFARTVDVCQRLLAANRVRANEVERLVLVGGPAAMPALKKYIEKALGIELARGYDPMTLVARGAALFAASANLDARPKAPAPASAHRLWLRHPAVSADLKPHVVGRVMRADEQGAPTQIKLSRNDNNWESAWVSLNQEAGFIVGVELIARRSNIFTIAAKDEAGNPVVVDPPTLTIVQGMSLSDPPLSRRIGIALASDQVQVYFDRGEPLPARRTFRHHTVETVARGSDTCLLKIPIVQGEFDRAHLCRLVGTLEIPGTGLKTTVPAGSAVDVTLELDRGGNLTARALLADSDQVFDEVAHLLVPEASVDVLEATYQRSGNRLQELRKAAFRHHQDGDFRQRVETVARGLDGVGRDIEAARGGDDDAGLKARRMLLELDAQLEDLDAEIQWPALLEEAKWKLAWAAHWQQKYGSEHEQRLFNDASMAASKARERRDAVELERQVGLAYDLGFNAFVRDPQAWPSLFEQAAAAVDNARDLPAAHALVADGRDALAREDRRSLERVVRKLWNILPATHKQRRQAFESGLR